MPTMQQHSPVYIVWKKFQRRVETLAPEFGAQPIFYHYAWEERSKWWKALSYLPKFVATLRDLVTRRPDLVFVQLPPTPALYAVALYCWLFGAGYVADCHNAMVVGPWQKGPLVKQLLNRARIMLVHNDDIAASARARGLSPLVLRTPLPRISLAANQANFPARTGMEHEYVIVPWAFAADEPFDELFRVAELLPHIPFVLTWYRERMPEHLVERAPSNIVFTGYLDVAEFNYRFAHATAALVLTTREGTQPSAVAEALTLEVPLVLSDLETTRKLNRDIPVYVANDAPSIVRGIEEVFRNRGEISARMHGFKRTVAVEMRNQLMAIKDALGLPKQIIHLTYMTEEA